MQNISIFLSVLFLILVCRSKVKGQNTNQGCGDLAVNLKPGTELVKFPLKDQKFSAETKCVITIKPPEGYTTTTTIESISIGDTSKPCQKGYFQLATTNSGLQSANQLCGNMPSAETLKATEAFFLQINMENMDGDPTFTLKFVSVGPNDGCGNLTLNLKPGTELVKFPLNDQPFSAATDCIITITPPEGQTTTTSIEGISIGDASDSCQKGYFKIAATKKDLESANQLCGNKPLPNTLSATAAFFLQINMKQMSNEPTFTLKFVSVGPNDGCGNLTMNLKTGTELVKFPLNDQPFSVSTNCIITITPPEGQTTTTSIESISIGETSDNCQNGYFKFAASKENLQNAKQICGNKPLSDTLSATTAFFVQINMEKMSGDPTFTLKFVSGVPKLVSSCLLGILLCITQFWFTY